ncbi:MAG: NAD(+) diphosphatase [Clostridium sp.]|nr:NAD(+) diphosphatase [Clostridiaceae bacterium]MDY5484302.1 NAD(+) diphosphatase [Clostridium sp.]
MIQDIAPHKYDNTYKRSKPQAGDYVFCIQKNKVLLPKEPESRPEGAEIPVLAEIEPLISNAKERAVYLFAIDEKPYYMVEIGTEEEVKLSENGSLDWKGTQYMRSMEPMYQAFAAITATQIWRWRESRRFCGHCGARMTESTIERALVCPECGQIEYPKISPAVIVAITNGDKLLMSRYRDRPYRGYALIAGFVEIGESFEETIRREVMEEVGLKVKNIRYFGSQPWAFTDTEMIGFFAELDGDDTIRLQEDELSEAGWYHRDEIPDDELRISVGSEMKMAFKYGTWK